MLRRRARVAVSLDQDESGGIILLLEAIESCDAWFPAAFPRVGNCGQFESLDRLRFDMHLYVNNKHKPPSILQVTFSPRQRTLHCRHADDIAGPRASGEASQAQFHAGRAQRLGKSGSSKPSLSKWSLTNSSWMIK
jgi:hypothetical protein